MGSNMMRQAVPLLLPQSPIVGTGLENLLLLIQEFLLMQKEMGLYYMLMLKKLQLNTIEQKKKR